MDRRRLAVRSMRGHAPGAVVYRSGSGAGRVRAACRTTLERYDGVRYGCTVDDAEGIKEMFERVRSRGFGIEVKSRIIAGTCLTEPVRSDDRDRKSVV